MAITLSEPPSSRLSNFFHDLVTVDFHQTDLKTGVRTAIILIIVTVLGLITGYAAEASFVVFAALSVLLTELPPYTGTRTRLLLTASIVYASIFAIGMVVSMSDNLVVPLCGLGLFIIAYFTVYPNAVWTIFHASLMFVVAITYQGATPAQLARPSY